MGGWARCAWALGALAAAATAQAPAPAALTPAQILIRAAQVAVTSQRALEQYAWDEREVVRDVEKNGQPGRVRSDETDEASQVNGIEYDRLIARNGKPLPPAEQAKEDKKQAAFIRRESTPKARAKHLREQAKQRRERERLIEAVPRAFELTLVSHAAGDPPLCDCYVIDAVPAPGYKTRDKNLAVLHHLGGTLWIDRATFGMVRMKLRILQPLSYGWVLARIAKGGELEMTQAQVDGHWFPQSLSGTLAARVLLFKGYHLEFTDAYSNYRKFGSSSRITVARHR
jgi:hypothetical protein